MTNGTTRDEINKLKRINMIEYFTETDGDNIRKRSNGTVVHKSKEKIVIYEDHSYTFDDEEPKPYKDIIGTLQQIYGYTFFETIEKLREYEIVYDLDL